MGRTNTAFEGCGEHAETTSNPVAVRNKAQGAKPKRLNGGLQWINCQSTPPVKNANRRNRTPRTPLTVYTGLRNLGTEKGSPTLVRPRAEIEIGTHQAQSLIYRPTRGPGGPDFLAFSLTQAALEDIEQHMHTVQYLLGARGKASAQFCAANFNVEKSTLSSRL